MPADGGNVGSRPGKHCEWRDVFPFCTGDRKAAEKTLIQIE